MPSRKTGWAGGGRCVRAFRRPGPRGFRVKKESFFPTYPVFLDARVRLYDGDPGRARRESLQPPPPIPFRGSSAFPWLYPQAAQEEWTPPPGPGGGVRYGWIYLR
jgi:hypothetical protein